VSRCAAHVAEAGFAILPVEVFDTLPLPAQPLMVCL
jgi:hypothetical protein